MNIGYEAKRFFTNYTGLGNYCRFVIDALTTYEPANTYYLYTPKNIGHRDITAILERNNVEVVQPEKIYQLLKLLSLWRTWGVSSHETIKKLEIFHGLSQELPYGLPAHIRKVVTVHDLIFLRYPQFYNPIDVKIYLAKVKSACNRADKVVAVSRQTADDLKSFLNIDESKLEVIHQGCNAIFRRQISPHEIKGIKEKYGLPDQYILNVGTIEERKNSILIVKALAALKPEDRLPLVIVGRKTAYYDKVVACAEKLQVLSSIIFIHGASFIDFPAIYRGASLFVYPSLFEGFGIPLIEAIESGLPVITSSGSCFSEAAGPDAVYINPTNPEELAYQIQHALQDTMAVSTRVTRAQQYIKRFQPDKIAHEFQRIYTQLK